MGWFGVRRSDRSSSNSRIRLSIEALEDRLTPSWGSVPPLQVTLPTSYAAVTINANGDALSTSAITTGETDWYRVKVWAGSFTFTATTPNSNSLLDPVIGVYNSAGRRMAYNDDASWFNTDSRVIVTLPAGTYFFGVTNYLDNVGGAYQWAINGPSAASSGFDITLQMSGLTASQQTIFRQAASRWSQIITGDLPDVVYNGIPVDDVLISASATYIDGDGEVLGGAGPDRFRSGSMLPYHGEMEFDSADMAWMESTGSLYWIVLHEMGHVLGIGTIWEDRGLLYGAGTSNPLFIGPYATAEYNSIFHTNSPGVPVEAGGGSGTRDSHWRESVFGNELMTGWVNSGANPLSRITIASLRDLGYQVNMNVGNVYVR